ncbi:MAG: sensor histidine kinase [Rubellimicrobium sp.]|nr:sensor histidine kinase [Rubellimicrobium sp.]
MSTGRRAPRLNQFFRISRLLAGQLDFQSAIRAVSAEIARIVPHDHLDVCILGSDGRVHTAYESGIDTAWGGRPEAPVEFSPICPLLRGEVDHILADDATTDPRFHFEGAFTTPILEHQLRARIHLPLIVHGEVIGSLNCSRHQAGSYGPEDVRNARYVAELLSPYFYALRAQQQARQSAIVEAEARAREEGLRQGALRLTEALEAERQRIGMDLHDQTLADLTRLARRIDRLTQTPRIDPAEVVQLGDSLRRNMAALRQIIEEARPTVMQLFGFAQAVEHHLDRAARDGAAGVRTTFEDQSHGTLDRLPSALAVALFRIVQEAVNNAVSHSGAGKIAVLLSLTDGGTVRLLVSDDGRGLQAGPSSGGSGLENMRTRARLIGAQLRIGPGPGGHGTTVEVLLPDAGVLAPAHPAPAGAAVP